MCEAKPGRRCAADTHDNVVVCMERYRQRHPKGPEVDPLSAAANMPQTPLAPPPATPPPAQTAPSKPAAGPAPALPPPLERDSLNELADAVYTADGYNDKWGAEALSERVGFDTSAYENTHLQPLAFSRYRNAHDVGDRYSKRLHHHLERERKWRESGYTPPGSSVTEQDSMYGAVHTGDRYDSSRPLREVAKDVRRDIKEAVAAGYLPDDLTYRVQTDSRGGSSIRVYADGMAEEEAFSVKNDFGPSELVASPYARQVTERLEGIAGAYTRNQNNSMVDYFNNSAFIYAKVHTKSEVVADKAYSDREKQGAALRKAERDASLTPGQKAEIASTYAAAQDAYRESREKVEAARKRVLDDRDRW